MKIILFSLIVLISTLSYIDTTEALAFEVSYKPNGIKLGPDPTVCTIEPTESDLTSKEVEKLMKQTKLAVDEWETKLQAETRNNKEGWDFNYIEINDKNRINADQSCDITFVFEPKPAIAEKYFMLGISDYDAELQTSVITIYYLEIDECYHTEREGDTIYYWYETCYGEDMRISNQINGVTKHEFGHAIGLGHYEPDDIEIAELWAKGTQTAPSIMAQIAFENSNNMQIRDIDIDMLYSIYGDDGFVLSENEEDYFELFKIGDYLEKKEYEKMQNYLDGFLKENPENDDANYYQALLHYELKNYEEAIPFLDKSIESQPENDELLYYQARSLYNVEKYAEALPYIERAVEINPDSLSIHSRHGVILFELGQYDDALNAYRMALSIDPENSTTLDRRGQVHHQLGDYEKALTYFDMALDVDPEDKGTLVNKANALFELEEYNDAIEYYEMVLDMDSKHLEALKGMAASLENIGDEREAAKYYERISLQDETPSTSKIIENPINAASSQIPEWIRNNASWWVAGNIDDQAFVGGIQFLIKEGVIQIPETAKSITPSGSQEIPAWIKNNADWWSEGLISDDDFLKGISFLVENGIITV
jgi:tetratricopeptide (TPR) repeat protein